MTKLNPKQEKFCRFYASDEEFFGNGTQSYIESYKPKKVGNWYQTARALAYELLTNPHILARINELLESSYLNDEHVDKQLAFLITQNGDLKAKISAIREYNELKARITKGIQIPKGSKGHLTISWDDGNSNPVQTETAGADISQQ